MSDTTSTVTSQPQGAPALEHDCSGKGGLGVANQRVENQPSLIKALEDNYNKMLSDPAAPSFGKLYQDTVTGIREMKGSIRSDDLMSRNSTEVSCRGQMFKFDDFMTALNFHMWWKQDLTNGLEELKGKIGELLKRRSGKSN